MFQQLSDKLRSTFRHLSGKGRLSEDNIAGAMREVRIALLEADVSLEVTRTFVSKVRQRSIGREVLGSLTPGQAVIKVVQEELVSLMGEANDTLNLSARPPVVVLVAGLQGAGKTTTVGKLANRLIDREKKSVMVVSTDIYRPAAIRQLETLAGQVGADFHASDASQSAVEIAENAWSQAKKSGADVLIVDTAGRLHVDDVLMQEIRNVHMALAPVETLFVVDAMTGQDAVNSATAFDQALPLTGVILTKVDGDARGGAALSLRAVTGKPIKFLGVGEGMEALEAFHPDRVASRILGMGDVLSFVEEVERKVDQQKAERLAKKLAKGREFDLEDLRDQILQIQKMGGMAAMVDKLPGMGRVPQHVRNQAGDQQTGQMIAIINSMTPHERRFPAVLRGTRKKRIAAGSGTQVQDVNRLLRQYMQMQKMMKRLTKTGRKGSGSLMQQMMGSGGLLPGGPRR